MAQISPMSRSYLRPIHVDLCIQLIILVLILWIPSRHTPQNFHPPFSIGASNIVCVIVFSAMVQLTEVSAGSSVLWPGLIPSSPRNVPRSEVISSWFQQTWHDPTLSPVAIFAALRHQRLLYFRRGKTGDIFRPQDNKMLVFFELESIKIVNEAIQNSSPQALSDGVVTGVSCLVHSSWDESMCDEIIRSPFQPPLRGLQLLDIYGSILTNPVHLSGLAQLIKLRGQGQTKVPGLASIIS
jgi:hypothetical protein